MSLDEKASFYLKKIEYFTRNAPLSDIQKKLILSAIKHAELDWLGMNDSKRACVRCASDKAVGFVLTVSPYARFSRNYSVCMKHIAFIEDYLEGKARKIEKKKEEFDANQMRLIEDV